MIEPKTAEPRILIHIPILHTSADLGALGIRIQQHLVKTFGERRWQGNLNSAERIWDEIEAALYELDLPYDRLRLYQDGLPICGRELDIVKELAAAGSRNHKLLLELSRRGAELTGTESGELLTKEYRRIQNLLGHPDSSAQPARELTGLGPGLIIKRDQFIASRIDTTLGQCEIGMLFLGMLHSIARFLPKDIKLLNLLPFDRTAPQIRRVLKQIMCT